MVSHEIPDIFFISQRVAMLEDGRIIFEGDPDEFQGSGDPTIQQFIRGLESGQDDLTGVAHQAQGEQRFREAMARYHRYKIPFSIILLTIENLGEINSKLGHDATHSAFKNIAAQTQQIVRITDTCSRFGMNRVLIILTDTNYEQATKVCSKIVSDIKFDKSVVIKPYPEFCFSVSAGIAEVQEGNRLDDVVTAAESSKSIVYQFNVC